MQRTSRSLCKEVSKLVLLLKAVQKRWRASVLCLQEENDLGVRSKHSMPVSRAAELLVGHSIPALATSRSSIFVAVACKSYLCVYVEGRTRGPCCRSHKTAGKSLAKEAALQEA